MSFSSLSLVSFIRPRAWVSVRISTAIAVGLTALAIATAPAAAADKGSKGESKADKATISDTSARAADRREDATADDRVTEAAARIEAADKTDDVRDIESEVRVTESVPKQECHKVSVTGSRMPKTVCTTVAQPDVSEKAADQRLQDYLRRRDELSTRRGSDSPYLGGGSLQGLTPQ